ncbi:MAG: RagB/SusD family nutrient uptake outer membrane protein [Bacteroidales bacterium]|nr:RagB/SusD family nutrient uptake outer membrane protein [Bacteroidales bacterium]
MKNLYRYIYLTPILLALFSGCDKDFLEKSPHDKITEETFWKTKNDATAGLAACYYTLYNNSLFSARNAEWDGLTDNSWDRDGTYGYRSMAKGPVNPYMTDKITGMYATFFKAIARYNDFLKNVEPIVMDEKLKNGMKAEVKFLRAMNYFYLEQLYGGVPIITEPYTVGDELKMRSTQEEVIALVISDLDYAIANLDDVLYTGHAVKGSAMLMKTRVLLSQEKWAEAASLSKSIMQSGKFSLFSDFKKLFYESGQENNPEIMFSTKYLSPNVEHKNGLVYGWWTPINPYQSFVDKFECIDGLDITLSPLYNPADPYKNRDPRLFYTIITPGSSWGEIGYMTFDLNIAAIKGLTTTNYIVRKVWEEDKNDSQKGSHCANDIVLMRYAEVLLSFAEAENEANGPTVEVYNALNLVRGRPGVNMPPLPTGLSKDQMRDKIRNERRIELAFEAGLRYFDLKRWKIAEAVLNNFPAVSGMKYVFLSNYYLWPILQSEIDYYKGKGKDFEQNPGY